MVGLYFSGAASIEVPPLGEVDFKLTACSQREGLTRARLTFTNQNTKEYIFYQVAFTASQVLHLCLGVSGVALFCMYVRMCGFVWLCVVVLWVVHYVSNRPPFSLPFRWMRLCVNK